MEQSFTFNSPSAEHRLPDDRSQEAEAVIRILAADDDPQILADYRLVLDVPDLESDAGGALELESELFGETETPAASPRLELTTCSQGDQAVEVVSQALQAGEPFSVVFLDVRMPPGPSGVEVAERLRELDPDLQIVIVTAFSDVRPEDIVRRVPPPEKLFYVQKPFGAFEIRQLARALAAKRRAERNLQALYRDVEDLVVVRTVELLEANARLARELEERTRIESDREKLLEQLHQAQKMEAVGRLAAGVAHDFNNLLTAIGGYTELLLNDDPTEETRREALLEIQRAGERGAALVRQLLAFGRRQTVSPRVLDLNDVLGGLIGLLARIIGEDIVLDFQPAADPVRVRADANQIEQVVMNLVVNARDAMPRGGTIILRLASAVLDDDYRRTHPAAGAGRHVLLEVSDTGVGMDAVTRSRIFEPFFTTKEKGHGTGLGLSTVFGIVKENGGSIQVYSEVGVGTTFRVYWPATDEAPSQELPENTNEIPRGSETILLVEDESFVRNFARTVLQYLGYTVLDVPDGEQALAIWEKNDGKVDLLLTDMVITGMSGRELADRLRDARPDLPVVYMSGYPASFLETIGLAGTEHRFLQKPFTVGGLARAIREAIGEPVV